MARINPRFTPEEVAAMNVATARAALLAMQTQAVELEEDYNELAHIVEYDQVTFETLETEEEESVEVTCWVRSGARLSAEESYTREELALEANASVLPTIYAKEGQTILVPVG